LDKPNPLKPATRPERLTELSEKTGSAVRLFKRNYEVVSMQKRFLKPLCERRAAAIFEEALQALNYPRTEEGIEEVRKWCEDCFKAYNPVEQELMRETLDRLLRDYKAEVKDYFMVYR